MGQPQSIISELEEAVRNGPSVRRVTTLRRITDLFLHDEHRLNDEQVKVFDNVLCHLVNHVEATVRAELGERLASLDHSPSMIVERLAWDNEIAVAGSILTHSTQIAIGTLVEVAKCKSQDHLAAISSRVNLPEAVTDVIVDRGDRNVILMLGGNASARFSEAGYLGMLAHAESDDELTEILGLRVDLPIRFLRDLLRAATEAVRARLASIAPAQLSEEIAIILKSLVASSHPTPMHHDFSRAEAIVSRMKGLNELNDSSIVMFAECKKFEEVAAALGILNNCAPTDLMVRVLEGPRADFVLIPCRSANLAWPTVETILLERPMPRRIDQVTLKIAAKDYGNLSVETAGRTLRFWQLHDKIEK